MEFLMLSCYNINDLIFRLTKLLGINVPEGYLVLPKPYCQNESLSNRFVMHPARGVGAFFLYNFSVGFCPGNSGEGL